MIRIQFRPFARRDSAFTMLEIALTVVILSVALMPGLRAMVNTGREAGFTESHLLASARAQALLDSVEAVGWVTLPPGVTIASIAIPPTAGSPPAGLAGSDGQNYSESLQAERLEDGLVMIRALVRWRPLVFTRGSHENSVGSIRLLRRADGSWTRSVPLGPA